MKFFLALLVAAYAEARRSPRTLLTAPRGVLRALLGREPQVDSDVKHARLNVCKECAVYFEPLGTCGSPLSDAPDMGCYCFMKVKSKVKGATCWLREQGIDDKGWPDEINGV